MYINWNLNCDFENLLMDDTLEISLQIFKYTGSSTYDQLPFWLVGRKSAIYLLTVFFNLSDLFIIFIQFIFLFNLILIYFYLLNL
jgi:hypothetical protein